MWGAYICMGAYKRDVIVVIRMGAYIHRVFICVGAYYYPNFRQCITSSLGHGCKIKSVSGYLQHNIKL